MRKQIVLNVVWVSLIINAVPAISAEGGFSAYGLGGASFGAGVTPPSGVYFTTAAAYLQGKAAGSLTIGGVPVGVGLKYDFFNLAANLMWVPETQILGGNLGVSVTVPFGWIELSGKLTGPNGGSLEKTVAGNGIGDIGGRVQLGWQAGNFLHSVYIQGVAPTGDFEKGFKPNIGLNKPAVDVGWGFTWMIPNTKLQLNGSTGFTFSAKNELTDYQSGNDFHAEWAIGYDFAPGLTLGVAGYSYRQLTGDSGSGAVLGPLKGSVDAVGPALSYSTMIDATPITIGTRYYKEYNVEKRFNSSAFFFTATMKF